MELYYTEEMPGGPDDDQQWVDVERTADAVVTAIPSSAFDWERDTADFDCQLLVPDGRGTTLSVDITAGFVLNLHYDAGGDRDWDTYALETILLADEVIYPESRYGDYIG